MSFGGGGGSAPTPPKFQPINIPGTSQQALAADIAGYQLSDQDLATRFPGLVTGNQQNIDDAYNQLTGPLDPTVQNSFVNQGLQQSLGAFGGGNPSAGVGTNSAGGQAVQTSLANNVQQKQDYDRTNFENMLAANPQRQFGLSGGDVTNMQIANIEGANANNQQRYIGSVGTANAQSAANAQGTQAAVGVGVSLASAALIAC